jgi:hypothetical protein
LRSESKRRMPPDRRRERRRSVHVHAREPSSAAGWQASAAPARLARARGRGPHRGSRPGADRPRPRVARPRAASYRRASDGLGGRRDPLAAGGRGYAPEPTSFFARRAGAQQPLPAVDEPAQRPCLLVRAPHLLEEIRRAAWPGCGRRVYQSWPWRGDQLEPAGVGTTTQATSGSIIRAIYVAPIVGPSAWSSAPRLGAHSSSACGLVSTVPAERYLAALGDRTSQWSRWMSTPSEAHLPSSRR